MPQAAYFDNIGEIINEELGFAQKSIFVAVAWFTDTLLFNTLLNKLNNG